MTDRTLPMGFVVATAFASGLAWLMTMMSHLPLR